MMKPFTKEQWDALPPKGKWDVQVALRGPDLPAPSVIKWFSTSVIRGKMKEVTRVGGLVNDSLNLIILPSDAKFFKVPSDLKEKVIIQMGFSPFFDQHHFWEHVRVAATWLGIPVMTLSNYRDIIRPEGECELYYNNVRKALPQLHAYATQYELTSIAAELKEHMSRVGGI